MKEEKIIELIKEEIDRAIDDYVLKTYMGSGISGKIKYSKYRTRLNEAIELDCTDLAKCVGNTLETFNKNKQDLKLELDDLKLRICVLEDKLRNVGEFTIIDGSGWGVTPPKDFAGGLEQLSVKLKTKKDK